MNLQTKIPLQRQRFNQIDYNSKVLLLGSCFSENIGNKFNYFKFQTLRNPFGILFQPLAIEHLITNAVNKKEYSTEDIFLHNEHYHCFDAHSKLSHSNADELLSRINKSIKQTHRFLKEASHIIITLGTAWAYRYIETDSFVANCHKILQKKFLKELLSVEEVAQSLEAIVSLVKSLNPDVNFIFTVSPVRHIKDGFVENTQSKSHLISAIHEFLGSQSESNHSYFPSFEIVMDELRDYRFYNEDMLHPNQTAINYIWEKFVSVWINSEAQNVMEEVENIQKGLAHKPFNPNSETHQKFIQNLVTKSSNLNAKVGRLIFE
ncbi:MAG: GSCFA domain-containing protein [Winogradskyella sp.]|uniref:GSCFA domain-containing protein n=1 Tax=Winogradskyella sp. TaxID=1883156 RepID=UPI00179C49BF|nr:GSCFA domain-containing protein [Winogradskyella sp.]MBT8244538.1 GSCFA domain-containing protein [Winogradskyella sp.]NNK23681.1 GSCFA domain-containing protein [Winogradskyella sp.]